MAKKEAFLQFLKAARSLQDRGLSKEAIVQFAKNEFGELSELFKKQIDSLFKPKKGIENIKKANLKSGFYTKRAIQDRKLLIDIWREERRFLEEIT